MKRRVELESLKEKMKNVFLSQISLIFFSRKFLVQISHNKTHPFHFPPDQKKIPRMRKECTTVPIRNYLVSSVLQTLIQHLGYIRNFLLTDKKGFTILASSTHR